MGIYMVVTSATRGRAPGRYGDVLYGRRRAWLHHRQGGVVIRIDRFGASGWHL